MFGNIKNFLALTFYKLPEMQQNQSCLGAETWAIDRERQEIVAINLPVLDVEHVM